MSFQSRLTTTTFWTAIAGGGLLFTGSIATPVQAADSGTTNPPAVSRADTGEREIAANPCNPCNPCAAANPCNPCNPCAAGGVAAGCTVPRLVAAAASPCNPCAAKNPCAVGNPCAASPPRAAANPCATTNPCATANPCTPCAARNPCATTNPCAAKNPCAAATPCNPCNPCAAGAAVELTGAEAIAAYDCIRDQIVAAYAKAGIQTVAGYDQWTNVAARPYASATHGGRYVNNYVNAAGAAEYARFEDLTAMPVGSVVAKDSFVVNPQGRVSAGPLFIAEKMTAGFNTASGNWKYTMIMPNGSLFGETNGRNAAGMDFCYECHMAIGEETDSMTFLPEAYRK